MALTQQNNANAIVDVTLEICYIDRDEEHYRL